MNERIKELMWDAGLNSNYVEGFDSIYSEQLEKFAELIVMECLTICEELGDKGMDGHYCADKINKTFKTFRS